MFKQEGKKKGHKVLLIQQFNIYLKKEGQKKGHKILLLWHTTVYFFNPLLKILVVFAAQMLRPLFLITRNPTSWLRPARGEHSKLYKLELGDRCLAWKLIVQEFWLKNCYIVRTDVETAS